MIQLLVPVSLIWHSPLRTHKSVEVCNWYGVSFDENNDTCDLTRWSFQHFSDDVWWQIEKKIIIYNFKSCILSFKSIILFYIFFRGSERNKTLIRGMAANNFSRHCMWYIMTVYLASYDNDIKGHRNLTVFLVSHKQLV